MKASVKAIKGMKDIIPAESVYWGMVEQHLREVTAAYGYHEIRLPVLESTALFKRSIGEVTDIVEKEMYTFDDRNGDSVTLRPEGTAGCVRACIQNELLYGQTPRLWYLGPMFRYERPQKGRYRQFYQMGVEVFGIDGTDVEAEIIALSARLWRQLGVANALTLEINTLGTLAERNVYRDALVAYFRKHSDQLDEDSQRRLETNPLRILDSKNPAMQSLINQAPQLRDYLTEDSKAHFNALCKRLEQLQIAYKINPRLVRGLDYYCHTVFEWTTNSLGAQGTVCAGGRYDTLVEQLGGNATPAVGFALGIERLILMLQQVNANVEPDTDVYLIAVGDTAQQHSLSLAEQWRDSMPWLRLTTHCGGGSFKSQFKRADKSGAKLALILGEDEIAQQVVGVKFLRDDMPQETVVLADLTNFLRHYFERVD